MTRQVRRYGLLALEALGLAGAPAPEVVPWKVTGSGSGADSEDSPYHGPIQHGPGACPRAGWRLSINRGPLPRPKDQPDEVAHLAPPPAQPTGPPHGDPAAGDLPEYHSPACVQSLEDRVMPHPPSRSATISGPYASAGCSPASALAGIVVDPNRGDVYVAADTFINAGSFNLYKITRAAGLSGRRTFNVGHVELVKMAWNPADGQIYLGNTATSKSTGSTPPPATFPCTRRPGSDSAGTVWRSTPAAS